MRIEIMLTAIDLDHEAMFETDQTYDIAVARGPHPAASGGHPPPSGERFYACGCGSRGPVSGRRAGLAPRRTAELSRGSRMLPASRAPRIAQRDSLAFPARRVHHP